MCLVSQVCIRCSVCQACNEMINNSNDDGDGGVILMMLFRDFG